MTQRDTIQGLISAIESITQGYHQGTNRRRQLEQLALQQSRQQQYDKYAANDETRAAERHKALMEGDKQKSPVERLLKIGSSLSTTDEARAKAAQTFAMANGDPDASIKALTAEMEKLRMSAPVEPDAMAKEAIDYDPSAYKDAAKSHSKAMADLEQAIATLSAFRLDNQGAPQAGQMAAPGQQPTPAPAAAPQADPNFLNAVEKLMNQVRAIEDARQRRAAGQPVNQVDSQMAARAVNNVVPVKVAPLVDPGQFTQQQIHNSFMSGDSSKGTVDWVKGLPGGDKRRRK